MKTRLVSEYEVRSVPAVQGTDTWNPVPHCQVIDAVNTALADTGLGIQNKRFELSATGGNLFASYRLDQGHEGSQWQLGFRNSVEKKFAVGITAGTFTIVCSNLVFTGDYLEFRKHTKGLTQDELQAIAGRAVTSTVGKMQELQSWQLELREIRLSHSHMRILAFEAMRQDAFPPSRFGRFLEAIKDEGGRYGQSLYTFYGAVTQTIRDQSLLQISQRSKALNNLVERYREYATRGNA